MLSCKEASTLVSQSFDRSLSLRERLGVRLHLLICKACPTFHRQMELIHQSGKQYLARHGDLSESEAELSPEARARIRQALAKSPDSDRRD